MKQCPIILLMVMSVLGSGCQALSETPAETKAVHRGDALEEARLALAEQQFFQARRLIRQVLEEQPDHLGAQALMAEILNQEIERQKEVLRRKVPEELDRAERGQQIRTWLERSRELFRLSQYEEALFAAEKVFTFDPQNTEASLLIDEIRSKVYAEGKEQAVFLKRMHRDEAQIRFERYKEQAQEAVARGSRGEARLAVEKALILNPDDPELIRLHEELTEGGV